MRQLSNEASDLEKPSLFRWSPNSSPSEGHQANPDLMQSTRKPVSEDGEV